MLLGIFNIFLCSNVKDILNSHSSDINVPGVQCVGTDCKKLLVCQSSEYSDVSEICTATMKKVTCDEVRRTEDSDSDVIASHTLHRHCPGHFRCRRGKSWELMKVRCVPHIRENYEDTLPNRSMKEGHVMDLGFYLQSGMRVTWELAQMNLKKPQLRPHIFFGNPDSNSRIYIACLRLWKRKPEVVFNTNLRGSGYGREERSPGWSPKDNEHFTVDVKIGIDIFQTYLDGSFLMSNKMRAPFARVRFVGVDKLRAWHKLHVGFDNC